MIKSIVKLKQAAIPLHNLKVWMLGTVICLGGAFAVLPVAAQNEKAVQVSGKLDNATCLTCHDGKKGKLEVPVAEGEPRALRSVVPAKFDLGVHAKMQCVACHTADALMQAATRK